jgi:VIT1/CCC1 family predicted Fe2+/Mn2+ transporter
MVEIMTEKGMNETDANAIIRRYAKYPDLFVDFMMNFELEMQVPDADDNPWKDGAVTFFSFLFFGIFPLLAYVIFNNSSLDTSQLFTISCFISAIMFFILGTLKTHFTKQQWWQGGLEILIMGSSTAAVSYAVGFLVDEILISSGGGAGQLH